MIIVNTETVAGREIGEMIGLVRGNIVQSKNVGKDIAASFKSLVGGEIRGYSDMLTDARKKATHLMVEDAKSKGADAIVNVRFVTSQIMQGASELLVYGTAVKLKSSE
ncbi:heavy metal-binding domain-containing protein (plasmid) [Rossellomorea sp. AcN35-11]|nr:heavy metal-binding domain-containing protein [Rossellomorea aquimaris]WJV32143.1 heavy metal-binding domain-containing protein [Rossellomorea sp. AcN35-11]